MKRRLRQERKYLKYHQQFDCFSCFFVFFLGNIELFVVVSLFIKYYWENFLLRGQLKLSLFNSLLFPWQKKEKQTTVNFNIFFQFIIKYVWKLLFKYIIIMIIISNSTNRELFYMLCWLLSIKYTTQPQQTQNDIQK